MKETLVSIIMPAYKASAVIGDAITSVCSQTYNEWELLIADDFSPDNTLDVIKSWAEKDSRIKLISLSKNMGPAAARNFALQSAIGRWIAFLDSDDLWMPEKLELTLSHAIANDAALTYTSFSRMSADGKRFSRPIPVPESISYEELLGNTVIATSTVLIDRAKVGEIKMRNTYYDDFDCWLQILKRGHRSSGFNKDLMRYRVMNSSVSRNKMHSALHVWRAYKNLEKLSMIKAMWHFFRYAVNGFIKYGRYPIESVKA
jgi:teichuronic acid biosynthesis glycosyltransferase TuaG